VVVPDSICSIVLLARQPRAAKQRFEMRLAFLLELWSHAEDVSLTGGVGGHRLGIAAVSVIGSTA
jgi:hypothetical protein